MTALFTLASTSTPPYLTEAVVLVVASAVIAYVCQRLRVLPIVGFLLTGVTIGPNALGLVRNATVIEAAAEIGVVLLLFTLGIEFSLERLGRIKRAIFIGGGLQMGLTIAVTMAVLAMLGLDWRTGIYTGSLVALSSTAIVLKVLGDGSEATSAKGQLALGMLIFQDLAIVALALLVPMLGGAGGTAAGALQQIGLAIAIVIAVLLVARRVMPIVLERVARTCSQEIFLLTIIAICIGTAWLTSLAGVSLSLGAFLAGLVVSESRYSHHAFAEILPLQILFSAVFFVSVGLLLDLAFVARNPLLILAVVAAIVVVKVLAAGASALLLRYPLGTAAGTALLIAQIGEFSFVLARLGSGSGLFPAGDMAVGGQTFIAAAVLLMVATPLLARAGTAAEARLSAPLDAVVEPEPQTAEGINLENHVIVAGYGSGARYLTRVLRDSGVPFVILTLSPTGAAEAERDRLRVIVGDYSKRFLLELAGIERAKMLVIPDDTPDMAKRVSAVARTLNPTLRIVVRTHANGEVDALLHEGADDVLVDELEVGIQLFTRVLSEYRVSLDEIDDHVATVRAGGYAALRTGIRDVPLVICGDLDEECFDTRTFTVREGTAAARATVGELAAAANLTISAIDRGSERFDSPDAAFALAAGDRITARASAEAFRAAARFLRSASLEELAESTGADARVIALSDDQRHPAACEHAPNVQPEVTSAADRCEECGPDDDWVHLRICMTCGGVRCCDSSKNRHATRHFESSGHPIIRSYERGEQWAWCYPDQLTF